MQNGKIPRFSEELLQEIFICDIPQSKCVTNLREGFNRLGLGEIIKNLPILLHLFRPSNTALTRRKLLHILTPMFSEDGCNAQSFENEAYAAFSTYTRKAAGGKRGNITLEHILQFVSGTETFLKKKCSNIEKLTCMKSRMPMLQCPRATSVSR